MGHSLQFGGFVGFFLQIASRRCFDRSISKRLHGFIETLPG